MPTKAARAASSSIVSLAALAVAGAWLGCGAAWEPAPVAVVTLPSASAPPAPIAPALPPEPSGLATVEPLPASCEVGGSLDDGAIELATGAAPPPPGPGAIRGPGVSGSPFAFGLVAAGRATVGFGDTGTFAQIRTSAWTLRGVAWSPWRVHSARWVAFGGVLFAGARDWLEPQGPPRGDRLVVRAPDEARLALAEGSRTAEVPCRELSFDQDAEGFLRGAAPPSFQAAGAQHAMILRAGKPVPIAADAAGAAAGTLDASGDGLRVTLLERRGARARIRWNHVAGWIDGALLARPKPPTIGDAAQFGMIGLLGGGTGEPAAAPGASPQATLVCTSEVRLVAVGEAGARVVVGAIPAGKPVRVVEPGPELSMVTLGGDAFAARAPWRLAVPQRDLAVGCTTAHDGSSEVRSPIAANDRVLELDDAIDKLDGDVTGRVRAHGHGASDVASAGFGPSPVWPGGSFAVDGGSLRPPGHLGRGSGGVIVREGALQVVGGLPPEVVRRIVRQNFGRFRLCYEHALEKNPALAGRATVRFTIDRSGAVATASDGGSDLRSPDAVACVVRAFGALSFPQPEGGAGVTVTYSVAFSPEPRK
jgi:hypothetical protein